MTSFVSHPHRVADITLPPKYIFNGSSYGPVDVSRCNRCQAIPFRAQVEGQLVSRVRLVQLGEIDYSGRKFACLVFTGARGRDVYERRFSRSFLFLSQQGPPRVCVMNGRDL